MRQVARFYNHREQALHILVEPLAESVELAPAGECHVLVFGNQPQFLEVSFSEDGVSVYASPNCDVAIFMNGELAAGALDFINPNWSETAKAEYRAWIEELAPEQI